MQPDLLSVVRSRLPERRQDLMRLAQVCEVPFDTLVKIEAGVTKDPRVSTVQALLDHWGLVVVDCAPLSETTTTCEAL